VSYVRTPVYIYPTDSDGPGVDFEGVFVPDRLLNAWLACIANGQRNDELDRRIRHGVKVLEGRERKFRLHP